jgi:bifunctional N-acetylglucosamine-1-phosphate-uridyltransferase/glucosamine-1-phosphate-acetyltransferase GlmU-like protein
VEAGAVIRGPAVVSAGCVVGAHAHLRGGVFLDRDVRVGPSCEVKASFVFQGAALAHLNYVGDSLIGARANLEAGAVLANRFNEREDKRIAVVAGGRLVSTGAEKFGASVDPLPAGTVSRRLK